MQKATQLNHFVNDFNLLKLYRFSIVLSAFFLLGFCAFSKNSSGQGLLDKKITLHLVNASIQEAFTDIQKNSGARFIYDNDIDPYASVRINQNRTSISVKEAIEAVLQETNLTYQLNGEYVLIKKHVQASPVVQHQPQEGRISGRVTDTDGNPLDGVSIHVVEQNRSYGTAENGSFTIDLPPGAYTLQVTHVAYQTQQQVIHVTDNGRQNVSFVLQSEASTLGEVVVVGYGTQREANVTAAVSTISEASFKNRVVSSVAKALQGADPSLNITFGNGSPDEGYGINIRGTTSVNGGTPLIMVDGVEVNLAQINPHDIASVTVLKDASAAAIYGAKASSGVILITTKSGENRDGSSEISYTGRMGFSQNTTSSDFIRTGYDHVNVINTFYNAYRGEDMLLYDDEDMALLEERRNDLTENPDRPWTIVGDDNRYYYYGSTDWYGHFFRRTRPQQEHAIAANGGNDKIRYYTSGRFWTQDGMFNIYEDTYDNYSFYTKVDANIKPWLRYTGTASFNSSMYKYAGMYNEQQTFHALQSNISSSFVPVNPDGSVVQYTNQLNANSPIGAGHGGFLTADKARNSRGDHYMVLSNRLDFSLTDDLTLTAMYAYKKRDRRFRYRNMPFEYSREADVLQPFTSGTVYDYYQESHFDLNNHNVNVYGTYDKKIGNGHQLKLVVGSQFEDYRETNLIAKQTDLLNENLSSFAVANGDITLTQTIGAFRTLGFFGRGNYDYRGKYLLEVSGRWDGTSRFAPSERWGFFPSASLGWRMSEENFWEGLKGFWDSSKLRLSMGSLGNQQVDYYAYFDEITASKTMGYTFDGSNRAYYASVSAPIASNLTWETVTTYNLGVDWTFFNNRLSFTGDLFIRDTKDMLTSTITLPSVYGASTPEGNAADLRTRGWEVMIGWQNQFTLASKPFHYDLAVGLGDYTNTITKFNNPDKLISDNYEGRKFGEIWGYHVAGLFATDADAAAYQNAIDDKAVNNRVYSSQQDNYLRAGDVEFIDLNGDGIINQGSGTVADPGDRTVIGNTQPRYNYSIRLGADWAGFDVSAFFQGVGKRDWMPSNLAYNFWGPYSFPSLSFIQNDFMDNVWSEENPSAYFPRPRGYASYSAGALGVPTDRYLQSAAYLRLKNLTVGYTLPIKQQWANNIRIYASGENLFYWSPLKRYTKTVDPELTVTSSTYEANSGVGYNFSKTYVFGLNVTF